MASSPAELGRGVPRAPAAPLAPARSPAETVDTIDADKASSREHSPAKFATWHLPRLRSFSRPFWAPPLLDPSQPLHTAASALGAGVGSVSMPRLGEHLAPLLGPLQGAQTAETTGWLFAQLQAAQHTLSAGLPHEQLAARFDVAKLRLALLRRDTPQAGRLEVLAAAPIERALETLLAAEVLRQLPLALLAPLHHLARSLNSQMDLLTTQQAERVLQGAIRDLQKEHPRPWGAAIPLLQQLCEGNQPATAKWQALRSFLQQAPHNGPSALATMLLSRSLFMGLKAAGLESTVAPWLKAADLEYTSHLLDHKGRTSTTQLGAPVADAVAGITNVGERSPLTTSDLQPGLRANTRDQPDLNNLAVQDAIRFGNPYASGVSGTTNMFLHAASYFNTHEKSPIDATALSTLLAALLCFDGGHGIHEVFAVANLLRSLPSIDLSQFQGYAPGHARGLFVDLAKQLDVTDLSEHAFDALHRHFPS